MPGDAFRVRLTSPARAVPRAQADLVSRHAYRARRSPSHRRDRLACGWAAASVKTRRVGLFSLRLSVTCTVLTGPRAAQEVHPEHATTRRERPNAIGIDTNSGPSQYGAVCKDLRGSVYPHPRTGHKGASEGRLWGAGATPRGLGRDFYWCGPVSSASQLFRTLKTLARGQCRGRWRPGALAG